VKKIIHINQHIIKANRKSGEQEPVITVKTYKKNVYGNGAILFDKEGREVARIFYRPDKPLPCGANVWIETCNQVDVIVSSL